jgi:GR25 family glycosyltransferase involved in LPS biosynthesis|tara:strand:+ start:708 stop:1547 length:840 start_codon:yes stop_codon:yes gene_type:complete
MIRKTRLNRKRKSNKKEKLSKRLSKVNKAKNIARKRTKKRTKKNRPASRGMPKIFVINLRRDPHKWEKYEEDYNKGKLTRYSACNGMEISKANPYYDRLKIMWNAGEKKRKCGAGILNSHMNLIKEIADSKIDRSLIVEDDVVIDYKLLRKMKLGELPQDSLIYFGGVLHPPTSFKDKTWSYEKTIKKFKNGINQIDPKKYRIFGGFGYYIPKWQIAKQLYDIFEQKEKLKPLDTEMTYLQKKGMIKYFYYPAISYLHMDDAAKGVHGAAYIKRDMRHY